MMNKSLPVFLLALVAALMLRPAYAIDTPAMEALLIDSETGTIMFEKGADERMPPSSMSKLMTVLLVFDRLKDGTLSLDDKFPVSEKAWRKGGSKMFVEINSRVRVEDLLRGIIVQSGNDACIVIAEALAGTEEEFAAMLNERAREIGLTGSNFVNATGWPHPDHYMTARDLARLAHYMIETYPEYYRYFAERDFTWSGIKQDNRNPLLYRDVGADGLKTGHTEAAGYGLTASAIQNDRRVVMVLNGLDSKRQRSRESARLIGWAFREFRNYHLFEKGEVVAEADVWLGQSETVPLVVPEQLVLTMRRKARKDMTVTVHYEHPIPAPIAEGQRLGTVRLTAPDHDVIELPLHAGNRVFELGAVGRLKAAVNYVLWGAPSN